MSTVCVDGRSDEGPGPLSEVAAGGSAVCGVGVRPAGAAQSGGPSRPVSSVQSGGVVRAVGPKSPRIQKAKARGFAPGIAAINEALAPLAYGQGFRLGLLGDSGCGKSYLAARVVVEYLRRSRGVVGVANSKGDPWPTSPPWPSESHTEPAELAARPPKSRVVVFTPNAFDESLSLEEVARWQWRLAARGWPSLGVYDEVSDGADDGKWLDPDDGQRLEMPRVWTHGRRPGISGLWGAQYAHQVPREPFEQAGMIFCWRQAGNALAILRRRQYIEGAAVEEAIRSLPGDDVPPSERGPFVVLRRARPWDGWVYRL